MADGHIVKIGVLMGFTGPIESLTVGIAQGARIALEEVNASGAFIGGKKLAVVAADTTCVDASSATASAQRLINNEGVVAIVGALCSGSTIASANNVAVPNGVVMVSPSSTSPAITGLKDNGLVFRTAPSDARQGHVLAKVLSDKGIKNVALSYTNNDYGKGFADAFSGAFSSMGGKVALSAGHEDGKADYSAEVAALTATGAKHLVVLGYLDQGGKGIIQESIKAGAFSSYSGGDGMIGQSIIDALGDGINGMIGTRPGGENDGAKAFEMIAKANGLELNGPFQGEAYDAAAIIALAMQAAKSTDRAAVKSKIMAVTNAPGEKIWPGQLAKALKIIAGGGDVNYEGASLVEFDAAGDPPGAYLELVVKGGAWTTVGAR
ncbi:MAG: ABC transporter substrate-binding protein [Proteobacteria bacterium]|nr:ABC transporter substrate-binding protein [Pseudomonadota bacterium]